MKTVNKRILSALLALVLTLSTLAGVGMAAEVEQFTDVDKDSWYYEYVDYVVGKGYFIGTSDSQFSPSGTMTRAMFVTVLSRLDGSKVDNNVAPFTDVPSGAWYAGAVKWAVDNSIVNGVGENKFNPNGAITREQMCAIMDRFITYYGEKNNQTHNTVETVKEFLDAASIDAYATKAVANCQTYGLVNGYPDGNFYPKNDSTRAQVAAVISRLDWLVNPTGGSGGGVGPVATSYTITFMDGTQTVGTVKTASNTSSAKTFTTMAALTAADKVFVNWNTAADGTGTAYAASTQYTATGNMT